MCIDSVILSNCLVLCCPLLLLSSIFPSIKVFSNGSALHMRWPKYWSFSIGPSNEYLGFVSFRMDWFDLLAVQGTLKSLFQHHNSKASVVWLLSFFIIQLSHPYMTTVKPIALTIKSLLLNMLGDLPSGPVLKNSPSNGGEECLIPGWAPALGLCSP